MSYVLVSTPAGADLVVEGWRVPAADVACLRDAAALAAEIGRRAQGAEARVAVAEAAARESGFQQGLEQGRREAAAAAAAAVRDLVAGVSAEAAAVRGRLGALSLDVVRRIAADVGPQPVLEAVAERAVREVLADAPLLVRVPVEAAPGVGRRLASLSDAVEVVADPSLAAGDCVVASRRGSAYAGLEVQLAALERAFAEAGG